MYVLANKTKHFIGTFLVVVCNEFSSATELVRGEVKFDVNSSDTYISSFCTFHILI